MSVRAGGETTVCQHPVAFPGNRALYSDQNAKNENSLTRKKRIGKVAFSSFPDRFRLSIVASLLKQIPIPSGKLLKRA
jgi:hypothetical protein